MSDVTLQLGVSGDKKSADLYCDYDAWNISCAPSGLWEVIGPEPSRTFASVEELIKSDLPEVVKWVARGMNSAPNGNGKEKQ